MKQYVIDASVVLSWAQGDNRKIDSVWILQDKLAAGEISLVAPSFLLIEVLNVLKWKYKVSQNDAVHFISSLPQLPIQFMDSSSGDIENTVKLVYTYQLSAYDALYLGLAKKMGCTLISLDKQLLTARDNVQSPAGVIEELGVE